MSVSIWWIRRDLRLSDQQALAVAIATSSSIIPLFILDPQLLNSPYLAPKRLAFMLLNLTALDQQLKARGSRLIIRQGKPLEVLGKLFTEINVEAIYAEADYSSYAIRRDDEIGRGFPLKLVGSPTLFPPGLVRKPDGTPYQTFTPYSKAWKSLPLPGSPLEAPERIETPVDIASLPIPEVDPKDIPQDFSPGESEAAARLARFVLGQGAPIFEYSAGRNMLAEAGTSQLSAYLRFGILSARQAVFSARQAIQNAENQESRVSAETWLNELIWREFFYSILYHFPFVQKESFQRSMRGMQWLNNPDAFHSWTQGKTGYPVVDAAMQQLVQTGWMHNRARMITASFLTKHLLMDWRWGEKFFMQHLVDGDPAANNGGWQWTAGTGVDAAPYFRIFNPITQGEKFDPEGVFIRRFLPELRRVPAEYIHQPWMMPEYVQLESGCKIGSDYPVPIVEHSFARQRALEYYANLKNK